MMKECAYGYLVRKDGDVKGDTEEMFKCRNPRKYE